MSALSPPTPTPMRRRSWTAPLLLALLSGAMFLVPVLQHIGVGAGEELRVAEAARAFAARSLGAPDLAPSGSVAATAASRLAVASVALGLRLFGMHAWAGRLPIALWATAGVVAIFVMTAMLADRRSAIYAAVAFATMPLTFVQARAMTGGAVGTSTFAIELAAVAVLFFHRPRRAASRWSRVLALLASVVGAGLTWAATGPVVAAVPLLGGALAWGLALASGRSRGQGRTTGLVALIATAAGAGLLVVGLPRGGAQANASFAAVVSHAAHALAPWSAFAPFALVRLFVTPPPGSRGSESSLRLLVVVLTALSMGAWDVVAAAGSDPALVVAPVLALACALSLRDLDRGAAAPPLVGIGTALMAAIVLRDLQVIPGAVLEPFGTGDGSLPEPARAEATVVWTVALLVFVLAALATWRTDDGEPLFRKATYVARARAALAEIGPFGSRAYVVAFAGTTVTALAVSMAAHLHVHAVATLSTSVKDALRAAPLAVALVPVLAFGIVPLARDACAWLVRRPMRGARGGTLVLAGLLVGLLLVTLEYPAVAGPMSPQMGFDAYARARSPGDALAFFGVPERTLLAGEYAGGPWRPIALADPRAALDWLSSPEAGHRRFLLLATGRLLELNTLARERGHGNLEVLDAHASEVVLLVSSLAPGEASTNPFMQVTLSAAPSPQHPLDVDMAGQLHVAGYDVVNGRGERVTEIAAGRSYRIRAYLRVDGRPSSAWQAFVHVEGPGRRHNADHALLGGVYPPTSWVVGDWLVDDYELRLPPNFTPGNYHLFFGLYTGETRMKVTHGPHDGDNRIAGADLVVR